MSNTVNIYVNKADIGLDLVDNTSDLNKPISTATQTALNGKEDKSNKSTDVNLGSSDTLYPSQLAVKTYVDNHAVSVPDATASVKGIIKLTGDLGGTADSPTVPALSNYLLSSLKGANNGLAELDGAGKVPSSQLPSYVDDVVEYATLSAFPVTGESGKIYLAQDTNLTYRWGGSSYVEISPSLALGETSSSAYRGDRGKTAYDHSQLTSGNPHNVTKSDVGLSNVVNSDTTTTANITDSSNKRFVTDAQLTVIGNTSGTNTGDQDLSGYATKNITLDRKTASYTLVTNDNGKMIEMNVASANTLTINASLFSAGNQILISQYGAGQTTITAGAGVTLRSSGGKLKTSAQYSLVTIIAISSTEFYIAGDLTA